MRKIGIIDIGSNTARLIVVGVNDKGSFRVINQLKESIRLGQDMGDEAILKPRRIYQTIKTLQMFKRLCEASGVDEIIAVATSAVRVAANQRSFFDEVYASVGIEIKVLSEEQESMLVYQGVMNSFNLDNALIMDIGGGSTKLIHVEKRQMKDYVLIPVGTITLTDMFDLSDKVNDEQLHLLENFIQDKIDEVPWLASCAELPIIGVGGSFRNLGKIIRKKNKYPLNVSHGHHITADEVDEVYQAIKKLDLDRRMKVKGLSNERADIFLGAIVTIKAVANKIQATGIELSGAGLRDGMIYQQINADAGIKPISDVLDFSLANHLGWMDEQSAAHAKRVSALAMSMFEQLRQLHKLPANYEPVVKTASLLHDVGVTLGYYNHQRHSLYYILNSGIFGLTHRELVMSAFAAGAHRKEEVQKEFVRYTTMLTPEDNVTIQRIGVLIRIAESFDRSMMGIITSVSCDVLGDSVIMKTQTTADASLEIKDALSANESFKKAYGKNLIIL